MGLELKGGKLLQGKLEEIARKMAKPATLRVGFLEGATYPDGTSVATVAAIQNFGAPRKGIPPRPFFTNMIQANSPMWGSMLAKLFEKNGGDATMAFKVMGEVIAGELRQAIISTVLPPNSPVTNLLKDRFPVGGYTFADVLDAWHDPDAAAKAPAGKPLVWTGHMLNSIDYEIDEGGEKTAGGLATASG